MNRRKLQSLIDRTVRHGAAFHTAQHALMEECLRVYGVEPGNIDCDSIIDKVLGGDGSPNGMMAEEFDEAMRAAMKAAGVEMPGGGHRGITD